MQKKSINYAGVTVNRKMLQFKRVRIKKEQESSRLQAPVAIALRPRFIKTDFKVTKSI